MRTLLTCIVFACLCVPVLADDSSSAPNSTASNSLEAAIKQRVKEFDATWATHDAKAIAAYYTIDGNIVTPDGNDLAGRDGIEQSLTDAFNGHLKDSTLTTTVEKVRLIKPDVAIVDSGAEMKTPDGEPEKLHLVSVLVKTDGKWLTATTRAIAYRQQ
ncbi:MAG TPA: SgcJ/EcaC family oxidoreductase [Tepidisphaeraceae bacterium]|jgi:uncharacterized protein (TIGR02246 family)